MEDITDAVYKHARKCIKIILKNIKNLGDHHDFYVQSHILYLII